MLYFVVSLVSFTLRPGPLSTAGNEIFNSTQARNVSAFAGDGPNVTVGAAGPREMASLRLPDVLPGGNASEEVASTSFPTRYVHNSRSSDIHGISCKRGREFQFPLKADYLPFADQNSPASISAFSSFASPILNTLKLQ